LTALLGEPSNEILLVTHRWFDLPNCIDVLLLKVKVQPLCIPGTIWEKEVGDPPITTTTL
jgi:hypothetical protein